MAEQGDKPSRAGAQREPVSKEKTIKVPKKKTGRAERTKAVRKKRGPLWGRFKRPFISLRWRIIVTYLLLLGAALLVAGASYMQIITGYLLQQEHSSYRGVVTELALQLSDHMEIADGEGMYKLALEEGRKNSGRILVLDVNGRVLVDSFSQYEGLRMEHAEVRSVLYGDKEFDAGLHQLRVAEGEQGFLEWLLHMLSMQDDSRIWVGYYTSVITVNPQNMDNTTSEKVGAVLLSVPIQELMDNISEKQDQMIAIFLLVAVAVVFASVLFSRLITRPVVELTNSITRMARGDFSQRVHPRGNNEIAQLGESFNAMSEKLKKLDESRNQFISNASHELKTPLSTIKLLVQSLSHEQDMAPELREEFLGDINNEIDRLNTIISDLLTLVQIDSNAMILKREDILLGELVAGTARRLAPLAKERHLTLEVEIEEDVPVNADPSKIGQVIYNLTDNAIKYTPNGGTVRIDLAREGKTAVIRVADSGIGIPEDDLPHIFDRFYRVDKARSRETGGTGLGLSIVQQIVLLHGGEIVALSQDNKGSTFIVHLPAIQLPGGEK